MPGPHVDYSGHELRPDAHAADGVVHGVLAVCQRQRGHLGTAFAARVGDRVLPGRVAPLGEASAESLHAFVTDHVEPRSTGITDAWQGYRGLEKLGYVHDRRSQRAAKARGDDPGELLPAVHRVASLIKRWLLGTHQGAVDAAHLPSYMNEFVFRFNRRRSRSRGLVFYRLLELAVDHEPVRYRELIATKRPPTTPLPRPLGRGNPPSLERPPANRPWRSADQDSSA